MPVHHVKGQPAASTYVRKKGGLLFTLIVGHPVIETFVASSTIFNSSDSSLGMGETSSLQKALKRQLEDYLDRTDGGLINTT